MGNLLFNPSFESNIDAGSDLTVANWVVLQSSAIATITYSATASDGTRSLSIATGNVVAGGYSGVRQAVYQGFSAGDLFTVRADRLCSTFPVGMLGYLRIMALDRLPSTSQSVVIGVWNWTGADTSFKAITGETTVAVPSWATALVFDIFTSNTSGGPLAATMLFDNVILDVLPLAGSTVTDANVSAGRTHDVAFLYDDAVGPVGFTITRDKNNMLAYFQEEAPVFGDPRIQTDSSASDFTLWRTSNQTDFAEGMGYLDFDQETGKKRAMSFKHGLISETGALRRGPVVSTLGTGGSLPMSTAPPGLMAATTYDASGIKRLFIASHTALLTSIDNGATWSAVTTPAGIAISGMCAFQRRLYVAYDRYAPMQRSGIGDATLANLTGNPLGQFVCADEGRIVRTLFDANNAASVLEQSVDGVTWTATTTFSDGTIQATGALTTGFYQGLFYFGTSSGIYSWDGTSTAGSIAKVVDFSTASSAALYSGLATNGRELAAWRGDLYFTVGKDLVYRFDGAKAPEKIVAPWNNQLIGPDGLLVDGTIEWIDLHATAWHLYVSLSIAPTAGGRFGYLYAFDGKAWTIVATSSDGAWGLCTFDGIEKLVLSLWGNTGSAATVRSSIPLKRLLTTADVTGAPEAVFRSSRLDLQRAAVPKLVSSGYLRYRNAPAKVGTTASVLGRKGANVLDVASVSGLQAGDWVWISPGGPEAQAKQIGSIAGTRLTFVASGGNTAALSADVPVGTEVVKPHVLMALVDAATGVATTIGGIYTNAVTDQLMQLPRSAPFVANRLYVQLTWPATSTSNTEVLEWAIRFIYAPEVKKRWRLSFDLRHGIQRLDGQAEERTTADMIDRIWAAKGARRLVTLYDIDGSDHLGRITQPEIRVEERRREHDGVSLQTAVATLQFIETDSTFLGGT